MDQKTKGKEKLIEGNDEDEDKALQEVEEKRWSEESLASEYDNSDTINDINDWELRLENAQCIGSFWWLGTYITYFSILLTWYFWLSYRFMWY